METLITLCEMKPLPIRKFLNPGSRLFFTHSRLQHSTAAQHATDSDSKSDARSDSNTPTSHYQRFSGPKGLGFAVGSPCKPVGMLDINLFRTDKGGVPKTEIVCESQRRRLADVSLVDQVTLLDKQWRTSQYEFEQTRKGLNELNEKIKTLKIGKLDATEAIKESEDFKKENAAKDAEVNLVKKELVARLSMIGNVVHDSVPVDNEEANNSVVRTWGDCRQKWELINHLELVNKLQIADLVKGFEVAGGGGYYLEKGGGLLNVALSNFGLTFLRERNYKALQPPFFMRKEIMARCAQLSQFDKELYKIVGDGGEEGDANDNYLISTPEQPLRAYHLDRRIDPRRLPKRYAGFATCFRKEAEDSLGLLEAHDYEEVNQFCITSPNDNKSWEMHEEMLRNAEDFYKELGIPYRVVNVVSGNLSRDAAKTYKIEGWFPASQTYKELASCSNYTDYLARTLGIAYGQKKQFVHLLNCTLTATHKTLCCILENYQTKDGVVVPEVLRPFMLDIDFLPFDQASRRLFCTESLYKSVEMLDLNLIDPQKIRESQRKRFADISLVDQAIVLSEQWRTRQLELQLCNKPIASTEMEVDEAKMELDARLSLLGNLVHDSVPVDNDEANNYVVRMWGECKETKKLINHVDLVKKLQIADSAKGSEVAGRRGYYLKDIGVHLNKALVTFALVFLYKRNYEVVRTPHFMRKYSMARCAQLSQFDEELYKLGDGDEKYLIATSEQPLCAHFMNRSINPECLPLRYVGGSTCFRKEAGSHGRDTLGIFRVHQFEKVEQFCITSPNDNKSWEMHEEMIRNAEDFYKALGIPYRVVNVVSGALNLAAAKKYDLEGWFPASQTYRELVSCSNCTDYQAKRLGIAYGQKKNDEETQQFVHMLNCTLTATERTICCIVENYQTEDGVVVPEVLRPFMRKDFLPFEE